MKYKYILAITILSFSVLMFNGCGKNDLTTEPVISDAIEEADNIEEIEEPVDTEAEVIDENNSTGEESTTGGSDVEVSEETVGNVTLTQEEIDALKEKASSMDAEWIDRYQSIVETGSYIEHVGEFEIIYDKVVGTPGDTSWRRMTDAEAQAIIDAGEPKSTYELIKSGASDEEKAKAAEQRAAYQAAEAELSNGTWSSYVGSTIYFDYYQYKEDFAKAEEQWRADHADELESGGEENLDQEPTQEELDYWSH